ncbi:hypothetical protein GQ53DRAFT_634353 [Thozetella sp. PMI_491]|nr:hypothetical protein GQ53DRAFT_634353 [Thozetella sp. PMI_491]
MARSRGRRNEARENNRRDSRDEYRPRDKGDEYRGVPQQPRGYRDYRDGPPQPPPSRGYDNSYRPQQGRDDSYNSQSYRASDRAPAHRDGYNNSYPPPPPRSPPPPAPGYAPPSDFQPPRGDFTFRFDKPAGVGSTVDSYRPDGGLRPPTGPRDSRGRPARNERRNDLMRGKARTPWRPFVAAERELLNARHPSNGERVMFNSEQEVKYKAVEELSDSDETDMDISGDEEDGEPSRKRARLSDDKAAPATVVAPKWSNPDPYTALPPPDTVTNQKKKDMVQLIRKARVEASEPSEAKSSATAQAAEYIACDSDDSEEGEVMVKPGPSAAPRAHVDNTAPNNAPTGPRASMTALSINNGGPPPASLPPRPVTLPDPAPRRPVPEEPASQRNSTNSGGNRVDAAPALGSRKRTHDDKIKLPDHARLKKVTKMQAYGELIAEWKVVKGEPSCPWNTVDHSHSPLMGVWLHKEIVDFYELVKPRDFEEKIRSQVVEELQAFCRRMYGKKLSVLSFGSFPSGLYLPTGDMDLVLVSDQYTRGGAAIYSEKRALWRLSGALRQNSMAHLNEIEVITKAKVPLVKYIEKRTGLKMDISFENLTGVQAIKTFKAWKEQYPAMPILVTLIKHFLAMRGLNEPVNGGIGGFSVICLVVSMLQLMPQVQSGAMDPAHHYGELLMEFFDLYGNKFNYRDIAISLHPPKYIPKNQVTAFPYKDTTRLSIIDPNNPENDIAGGSSNAARVMQAFSDAHRLLHERMEALAAMSPSSRKGASILQVILAGNYSSFRLQREHLQKLFDRGLDYEAREAPPRQPRW